MHMLFVDESGTPPKKSAERPRPYFVLSGVIIPEEEWISLQRDLQALKDDPRFRIRGEIKWRFFGDRNADRVNPLRHLDFRRQCAFRAEFFALMVKRPRLKIISCVTNVRKAYEKDYIQNEDDLYEMTYKPISERFQYYLQDANALGVIVCDHRGRGQDERLRNQHQKLVSSSASVTSNYDRLIESLFLTPSHLSVGIQFADMTAGAIARAYNSEDATSAKIIKGCFRRGGTPARIKGFGLCQFPGGGQLRRMGVGWVSPQCTLALPTR